MTGGFRWAALAATAILGACSSIAEGTSQQISVVTNPPGAACKFHRNGEIVGMVNPTPGGALIKKTKHHIEVVCDKDGYQEARYLNKSGIQEATFGNIILGGGIGWAIDSASGADNKYEDAVNITMVPKAPGTPSGATSTPSSSSAPSLPIEERLQRLKALFEGGSITQQEYESRRREILSGV
jgi:hypothetical protein